MVELWSPFLLFPLIGAVSGLLAGLFGIGGGLVIVPALNLFFAAFALGIPAQSRMHFAIGSSLAVIVFTAVSSMWAHHRRGAVLWPAVRRLVPGIVAGGLFGAALADAMTQPIAGGDLRRLCRGDRPLHGAGTPAPGVQAATGLAGISRRRDGDRRRLGAGRHRRRRIDRPVPGMAHSAAAHGGRDRSGLHHAGSTGGGDRLRSDRSRSGAAGDAGPAAISTGQRSSASHWRASLPRHWARGWRTACR